MLCSPARDYAFELKVTFCVRGVVHPLLANVYMNRLLKGWRNTKRGEQFQARVVSYADDFVILSRGKAAQALDWTRGVVTRLGLTLNEAKTSIKQARKESFDFLGYTFGPHCFEKNGRWYLGASPSKKSVARIKQKVGDLLGTKQRGGVVGGAGPTQSDSEGLVCILQLWHHGRSVSGGRLLRLRKRTAFPPETTSSATRAALRPLPSDAVFGKLGVVQLRRIRMEPRS